LGRLKIRTEFHTRTRAIAQAHAYAYRFGLEKFNVGISYRK